MGRLYLSESRRVGWWFWFSRDNPGLGPSVKGDFVWVSRWRVRWWFWVRRDTILPRVWVDFVRVSRRKVKSVILCNIGSHIIISCLKKYIIFIRISACLLGPAAQEVHGLLSMVAMIIVFVWFPHLIYFKRSIRRTYTAAAAWKSRSWYTSSGMCIHGGGVRQDWEASRHTTLMRRICPMFSGRPTRPTGL